MLMSLKMSSHCPHALCFTFCRSSRGLGEPAFRRRKKRTPPEGDPGGRFLNPRLPVHWVHIISIPFFHPEMIRRYRVLLFAIIPDGVFDESPGAQSPRAQAGTLQLNHRASVESAKAYWEEPPAAGPCPMPSIRSMFPTRSPESWPRPARHPFPNMRTTHP